MQRVSNLTRGLLLLVSLLATGLAPSAVASPAHTPGAAKHEVASYAVTKSATPVARRRVAPPTGRGLIDRLIAAILDELIIPHP